MGDVERLSHLALRVTDLEQAVKFYTEVVGLTVLARPKPGEPPLVVLKEGIGLKPASAKAAGTVIDHVAFKVGSLAPVMARLAAAGVPLPWSGHRSAASYRRAFLLFESQLQGIRTEIILTIRTVLQSQSISNS